jgi:hypothetical protein
MKKTILFSVICLVFLSFKTQAQPRRYVARTFYFDLITYQHALGAGIYGSKDAANWAATYSPRANLIMLGNNSISLGMPLALGLSGKGPGGIKMTYNIPFVFDFNLGHNALPENSRGFGSFFGAGYGFSSLRAEFGESRSQGLFFNAGARGLISDRSFTLRASYTLALKKENPNVSSVSIEYNF